VFTIVFTVEAIVKIVALNPAQYIVDAFNLFDFSVVIISWVAQYTPLKGAIAGLLRLVRVMVKLLRVLRTAKFAFVVEMRNVITSVLTSLPGLINIGSLLLLLYFVYAVLGMNLMFNAAQGGSLNEYYNFESFPVAFITLFRFSTGDDWNGLMHDAMQGQCKDSEDDGKALACGGFVQTLIFFLSFFLIGIFIMLNVFVAVICDNIGETRSDGHNPFSPGRYLDTWYIVDKDATLLLHWRQFETLLHELGGPMGFSTILPERARMKRLLGLRIPIRSGYITRVETYDWLCRCGMGPTTRSRRHPLLLMPATARVRRLLQMQRVAHFWNNVRAKKAAHEELKDLSFWQQLFAPFVTVGLRIKILFSTAHEEHDTGAAHEERPDSSPGSESQNAFTMSRPLSASSFESQQGDLEDQIEEGNLEELGEFIDAPKGTKDSPTNSVPSPQAAASPTTTASAPDGEGSRKRTAPNVAQILKTVRDSLRSVSVRLSSKLQHKQKSRKDAQLEQVLTIAHYYAALKILSAVQEKKKVPMPCSFFLCRCSVLSPFCFAGKTVTSAIQHEVCISPSFQPGHACRRLDLRTGPDRSLVHEGPRSIHRKSEGPASTYQRSGCRKWRPTGALEQWWNESGPSHAHFV
jgi:hypothetical protein